MHARIKKHHRSSNMTRRHSSTLFQTPPLAASKKMSEPARVQQYSKHEIALEIYTQKWGVTDEIEAAWRPALFIEPFKKQLVLRPSYGEISRDILDGIPQASWDEFIDHLENKEVLEILNLSCVRQLWKSYNFCISPLSTREAASKELMRKRAGLMATHHFLQPVIEGHTIPRKSTPSLWIATSGKLPKGESKKLIDKIQYQIATAQFNPDDMKEISPYFIRSFFKKISHCSDDMTIHILIQLLDEYAKVQVPGRNDAGKALYAIDPKRLQDAIDWLPSSQKEPERFHHAIKLGKAFLRSFMGSYERNLRSNLFFNSRHDWPSYEAHTIESSKLQSLAGDYFEALFNDLILRMLLQHLPKNNKQAEAIIDTFKSLFCDLLADSLTFSQLNELQQRWHRNIPVIESEKPPISGDGATWLPIISEIKIDDIICHALTSEKALREHGEAMHHCVGGYVRSTLKNHCDILELIDGAGIRSTIECRHDHKAGTFVIHQHAGVDNAAVSDAHKEAAKKLLVMLNETKTIAINKERLNDPGVFLPPFPYDVNDLSIQEKIYKAYRDTKTLPSKLHANDYASMLKKTNFAELTSEYIAASKPKEEDKPTEAERAMRR